MDIFNFTWLVVYSLIGTGSYWFYSQIIQYIVNKPLGKQSVFDGVSKDSHKVTRMFGSIYCGFAVITR